MAGNVTITGTVSAAQDTRTLSTLTITNTNSVDESIVATLATGDNTFVVPAGSVGVVVIPGTGGLTGTVKYRTNQNSSDTGLQISNTNPMVKSFPTTIPTSIIINSSVTQTATIELWFW